MANTTGGDFGVMVFNSLPSWLKGKATFSRITKTYNAITGAETSSTTTSAKVDCVTSPARGTGSEGFLPLTAIREKYVVVTVPAQPLGAFRPQANDTVAIGSMTLRVIGLEPTEPDGTTPVVYKVITER